MVTPLDPTAAAFLLAENRQQPMHVGGLQLFEPPEDAGPDYVREIFAQSLGHDEISPLFLKRPHRSIATGGQWVWVEDDQFDCDYHVRQSALAAPGRIRELLDLCGRLHGTRLALERPLWETHVIEGLEDGRVAIYTKMHHALVDGVSAMRLLQSQLTTDPDRRDMPPPWGKRQVEQARVERHHDQSLADLPVATFRSALALSAEAAGMPAAFIRTLARGVRNDTSSLSLYAPRTIINKPITGSRRFAAQSWDMERMKSVGAATGTTINDVVLAMCSGAMRRYLLELGALPDSTLVSMVPVGLKAKEAASASPSGGNAVGCVMVKLGTDVEDPAERLWSIHRSMKSGKEALATMTPAQIMAMSALGMAPAVLPALLRLHGISRPPFNLIISNVPGPKETHYFNGARLDGMWPLSIPIHGMALNITCTSYAGEMGFGLTGCRRTVPHLQRLLVHLDDELATLEKAAGV
ncbi:MAG TPA: wax ester/triacylglycerol synthase family O-acyltransferase [Nocardioidaceae bacterium]|nr:wax ester/triacylglycerol synthase family O-acyltransferase [Nocardioidaceae bacterium]